MTALADWCKLAATASKIGIKIITVGVLFIKALIAATNSKVNTTAKNGNLFESLTSPLLTGVSAPVRTTACPKISKARTATKAGDANPISR